MNRSRSARILATATTLLVLPICLSAVASGRQLDSGTFHDEPNDVVTDFCDVEGLTVEITGTVDGRYHLASHGAGQVPYYMEHIKASLVYTNADTRKSVSSQETTMSKDLEVTDNGDDTFTIISLGTGNFVVYDDAGNPIARNPGQTRSAILIDNGGTPTDPSDDEFLDFLGVVKESTGRTDDFCEAVVPELG